jgi:hypothetical protein
MISARDFTTRARWASTAKAVTTSLRRPTRCRAVPCWRRADHGGTCGVESGLRHLRPGPGRASHPSPPPMPGAPGPKSQAAPAPALGHHRPLRDAHQPLQWPLGDAQRIARPQAVRRPAASRVDPFHPLADGRDASSDIGVGRSSRATTRHMPGVHSESSRYRHEAKGESGSLLSYKLC